MNPGHTVAVWMYGNDNGHIPRARLLERLHALGLQVLHDFDMRACHVLNGRVYTACGRCLSDVDVLFHMNADEQTPHQEDILRAVEASGVTVINDCAAFFRCKDKFVANAQLRRHGVQVPESALLGPQTARPVVDELFRRWGALVYKPRGGHGAVGIVRFTDPEQFTDFLQATEGLYANYYVEQFIEFGEMDSRVEVYGGRVVGGYSRHKRHSFKTNISSGGRMMPREIREEAKVAVAAARALQIDGTVVDMVQSRHDGRFYVLEVNPLLGIFVESAMRAGTKMEVTEPDPAYCYDDAKIEEIANHIDTALRARRDRLA
jgi:ribosomal protein S6--L-glutamate ligase